MEFRIPVKNIEIGKEEGGATAVVNTYHFSRKITPAQFGEILSEWLNINFRDQREGLEIGRASQRIHRTLQASLFRFALGIILGIAETEWTDARNETAVNTAKKIKEQVENGTLEMGYMI